MKKVATNNFAKMVGETGLVASPLLSRMFTIGDPSSDIEISDLESDPGFAPQSFVIIPLGSGTIHVHMAGAPTDETYVISAIEVEASIGYPLPYLVDKVYADSDTTATLNIGW